MDSLGKGCDKDTNSQNSGEVQMTMMMDYGEVGVVACILDKILSDWEWGESRKALFLLMVPYLFTCRIFIVSNGILH